MIVNFDVEDAHYLLDSNIISEIIKPEPNLNVLKKLAEHASDCAICAPVWEELNFGVKVLPDGLIKTYLQNFICEDVYENFKIKSYTEKAADIHATLRADLQKLGKPTQKSDSMIASIALANHMVLVTRNTEHFEAIAQVSDLVVENWWQ